MRSLQCSPHLLHRFVASFLVSHSHRCADLMQRLAVCDQSCFRACACLPPAAKIAALACCRMNTWSIIFRSYGKLNRRQFFEHNIFRPMDQVPPEAMAMLERWGSAAYWQ